MERLSLILVAAGEGRRIGRGLRKALIPIGGKPLLLHTLDALRDIPHREETILVIHSTDRERLEADLGDALSANGVTHIVDGGKEREDSVRAGLEAVSTESSLVAIHDAARPFVQAVDLEAVVEAAALKGAAILAIPVPDTVKVEGDGRCIERTASRESLWLAQTPQVFRREIIIEAHRRLEGRVTDDAEAVERAGWEVTLVPASGPNPKITTPADLEMARRLLATPGPSRGVG